MPKVDEYLGLAFYLYFYDHPPPHIHVKYGEHNLSINLKTAELMEGYLPPKKRKLAIERIKERQAAFIEQFNQYSK